MSNKKTTDNMIVGNTSTFLTESAHIYDTEVRIFTYVLDMRRTVNEKEPLHE